MSTLLEKPISSEMPIEVNEEERNETSGKKTDTQEPQNSMQLKSTSLEMPISSEMPIAELINNIQKTAKKYRTGIFYTDLKLSSSFLRPKVWSCTRMCLYEFEMVHRFLQNREYFDVKGDTLLLAIMYCCIMFALKILLKQCQKNRCISKLCY